MRFDFIFIVTYGRSGSTLLQGVLNSIPGVLIRGENRGALKGLYLSYEDLRFAQRKFMPFDDVPESPFYGLTGVDVEAYRKELAAVFVRQVLRPPPGKTVLGFKEIRYFDQHFTDAELEGFLRFLRDAFPRAAIVINTRNIEDAVRSAERHGHGVTGEDMRHSDRRLRALAARGGDDVIHVHYDEYREAPERLAPLFAFLGAPFDRDAVARVFARLHSVG